MKCILYLISGILIILLMLFFNQYIEVSDFVRGFCTGLGSTLSIYGLILIIIKFLKQKGLY